MNIDDSLPVLTEKLKNEKLVLFVGAGLSRASGLPDWKGLFRPFCQKLNCPDEENYPAVATAAIEKGISTRKEIIEHIVKEISRVDFTLNENHLLLKELPFKIIITTNYDNLLEDLYGATKLKRIYTDAEMANFDPLSPKIQLIYMHGDINNAKEMVVSSLDYQKFTETHPTMIQRLKPLLQEYTFLFIGYSASDPNLNAVFDSFRLTYKENAQRHFIVISDPGEVKQIDLRTRYGIEPVIIEKPEDLTVFLKRLKDAYNAPETILQKSEGPLEDAGAELVKKVEKRSKAITDNIETPFPVDFAPLKPFNIPHEDLHFTGREKEVDLLKDALLDNKKISITALFGMGGIGKTSLAKHLAHKLKNEGLFKDGICWHRLEAKEFADSLDEIAMAFGISWQENKPDLDLMRHYFMSIIDGKDVLFIFDNAEYPEKLPPLLDLLHNHPVLITSRHKLGLLTDEIDLSRLSEGESLKLFIKTWKQDDNEEKIKEVLSSMKETEKNDMKSVCSELLGDLPLAISIIASVLRFKGISIEKLRGLLQEKKLDLLKGPDHVYLTEKKNKDVRFSFDFSFDQLPETGIEKSLFTVMGIFGGEDFSRGPLYEIFKEERKENIDGAIDNLTAFSLVQKRDKERLSLHPLMREYAIEKLPEFKGDAAYEKMAGFYVDLVESNPKALEYEWKNALNAVDWCLGHEKYKDGLFLILKIDGHLYEIGLWNIREERLKKGIKISEQIEELSYIYDLKINLADLYIRQGHIGPCKEIVEELSILCGKFKFLNYITPELNYRLAYLFDDFQKKENAFQINLENIRDATLYNDKEILGAVYRNLGNLFRNSAYYENALRFYRTNLAIKDKFDSIENKIMSIDDIADCYCLMEEYDNAFDWLKKFESKLQECTAKELEAVLNKSFFNYYVKARNIIKAEEYLGKYEESIKTLGRIVATAEPNYLQGLLLKEKGEYKSAVSTLQKAVQFYKEIKKDDEAGECYLQMGICHLKGGDIRNARRDLDAALAILEKCKDSPKARILLEGSYALLEAKAAYDDRAIRMFNRTRNTLEKIGIPNSKEIIEIESDIKKEIGEERYHDLTDNIASEYADETIDLGGDFLNIDPEEREIVSTTDNKEMALVLSGFQESEHFEFPVYLYPYYVDRYPVTNKEYKVFVDAMDMGPPLFWDENKIPVGMEDHPVVGISYDDALAYAEWASKDIPLEVEWEIAAGIANKENVKEVSNQNEGKPFKTPGYGLNKTVREDNKIQVKEMMSKAVKIKTYSSRKFRENKSPYGIYDLLGNTFEYSRSFIGSGETDSLLVLKGFSWLRDGTNMERTIWDKQYSFIHNKWADVGFRCVKRIYSKEDLREFLENKDKCDINIWLFNRANHLYELLTGGLQDVDEAQAVEKGIKYCQRILVNKEHKKAARLLLYFKIYKEAAPDFRKLYEDTVRPLIEKHRSRQNELIEIFSEIEDANKTEEVVRRHSQLKDAIERIDAILMWIEEGLPHDNFGLRKRNGFESLDYLLIMHEEKLDFPQYVMVLFLCVIKIKTGDTVKELEGTAIPDITVLTPVIKNKLTGNVAFEVRNKGLSEIKDIVIELSGVRPPQAPGKEDLIVKNHKFNVPKIEKGDKKVFEVEVQAPIQGKHSLFITLFFTDSNGNDYEKIIEENILISDPGQEENVKTVSFENPYFTGRPVQTENMYFGRRDVLERIEKRLGPNNIIILYGQRRTGKTSTLFQLKDRIYKDKAVPIFLTMQSIAGSGKELFFFRMAYEVYEALKNRSGLTRPDKDDFQTDPQYQFEIFLKAAIEKTKGLPIIFLIDEFDGLLEMIKEKKIEHSVLDNLRAIMQHYQEVWFLLAGTQLIKQLAADYRSALFNIATYEKIGALDKSDAKDLIIGPVKGHVRYEAYVTDKIISLTGGYPYFIQMVCFEMVYYLQTAGKTYADIDDLNSVVSDVVGKGSTHFEHIWHYLSDTEKSFLSLLAEAIPEYEGDMSLDSIKEIIKGRMRPDLDIRRMLEELKERDLVTEKKRMGKLYYGLFIDLFKLWISSNHPVEK